MRLRIGRIVAPCAQRPSAGPRVPGCAISHRWIPPVLPTVTQASTEVARFRCSFRWSQLVRPALQKGPCAESAFVPQLNRPMPPYCIFPSFTLSRTVPIPPATFGAVCLLITQTTPQGFEQKTDMNRPDHIALGALSSSSTRKNFTPPQASSRLGVHERGIDVHLRRQVQIVAVQAVHIIRPISWCQETVQALKNYGRLASISAAHAESAARNSLWACGAVKPQIELVWLGAKVKHTNCMIMQKVGSGNSICMIVWGWKCHCIQPPLQALCEAFEQQRSSGAPSTLAPFKCSVCVGIQDYSPIPTLQLLHSILASIFSFHLVSNDCSVGSTIRQNRIPGISIALAPGVDGLGGCRVG